MDFQEIVVEIFSKYLTIEDVSRLDVAICDKKIRLLFLGILKDYILNEDKDQYYKEGSIIYMSLRGMKIRHLLNFDDDEKKITYSNDEALKIADSGITLESMNLDPSYLAQSTLIAIIESCKGLKELKFDHCENINDDILSKICECSHRLLILDFGKSFQPNYNTTESTWMILAENCPLLQSLNLHSTNVTDAAVRKILDCCHQLRSLNLSTCGLITDGAFVKFNAYRIDNYSPSDLHTSRWGYLMDGTKISDLSRVYHVTNDVLNKMLFVWFQTQEMNEGQPSTYLWDDGLFVEIEKHNLPNLTHLNLSYCTRITDLSLLMITTGCSNLQNLNLNWTKVTDVSVDKLAERCSMIRYLDLTNCDTVSIISILRVLELCQELAELILSGCVHLPAEMILGFMLYGKALKHLNLRGCSFANFDNLSTLLESRPNITKLSVWKSNLDFMLKKKFPLVTFVIDTDTDSESEGEFHDFDQSGGESDDDENGSHNDDEEDDDENDSHSHDEEDADGDTVLPEII